MVEAASWCGEVVLVYHRGLQHLQPKEPLLLSGQPHKNPLRPQMLQFFEKRELVIIDKYLLIGNLL